MTPDPKALRGAFSRYMTGVTVVTAIAPNGERVGFTANSFTSVSLTPPLLLVCPGNHLSSFEVFQNAARFGVSILAEGQEDISNLFASSKDDRFGACDWTCPEGSIPLITGRAAGFVCDTYSSVPAGDHQILIGQVTHFDQSEASGLGYGPDGYFSRTKERQAQAPGGRQTRACILLEHGEEVYLTPDMDLLTYEVAPGASPLKTLQAGLAAHEIEATPDVVYAVYDDPHHGRRVVFRGRVSVPPDGLTPIPIADLPHRQIDNRPLMSLLTRFSQEHATQNFGFYLGDHEKGDVLRTSER